MTGNRDIERELQAIEAEYASQGGQQAGLPRLRGLRGAIEVEVRRLRAEVDGQRDGEAQEIVTLRNQLANALDSLKYEHDQRLQIERAYVLADTLLRDVREWYRCPWKYGASVEVIDLQRHAEWIARLDAFLAGMKS